MNVLDTYILHKAFRAVAVRPFQAALLALRHRVKNSELANGCLYIKPRLCWFHCFVCVSLLLRQCYVNVTSVSISERSEAHWPCYNLLRFNLIFVFYFFLCLYI